MTGNGAEVAAAIPEKVIIHTRYSDGVGSVSC